MIPTPLIDKIRREAEAMKKQAKVLEGMADSVLHLIGNIPVKPRKTREQRVEEKLDKHLY